MKKPIYPCLWFDGNAKEAAEFYCSVFEDSIITDTNQMVTIFKSSGQVFMCLNGGSQFKINPSISFYVICESEKEIDETWNKLIKGGSELMPLDKYPWSEKYGWVQDQFGVSWQLSFGKLEDVGQKITPVLMFTGSQHGRTLEAIDFYSSIFDNSSVIGIMKYTKEDNDIEGTVKHSQFRLDKNVFMAMDSSYQHQFGFTEAISFVVECETQKNIDYFWTRLQEGGEEGQCGWLKDKFGISWQIVPSILKELMNDPSRSERVVSAFMQMKKFEIEKLVNA